MEACVADSTGTLPVQKNEGLEGCFGSISLYTMKTWRPRKPNETEYVASLLSRQLCAKHPPPIKARK